MSAESLGQRFEQLYGREPQLYQAPGRVNLIGEHTDYNDGFVMPAAIGLRTTVAIAPRTDRVLRLHSVNFDESVEFTLPETGSAVPRARKRAHWSDYVCGVAVTLESAGYRLSGADIAVLGEVPIGSGLSSSAALEVAAGYGLLETAGHPVERVELARLCQRAENEYVGMRCGIMDQFVASCARRGSAILLDCRSLEHRWLPLPGEAGEPGWSVDDGAGVSLVVCNTMIRHQLALGEYNLRREECEEAVRALAHHVPGVCALRDVTLADLERHRTALREVAYRRARHVVTENARVLAAAAALERADLAGFGRLLGESHRSLRDDFQVSCDELDLMVRLAGETGGVFGARMTGGGFGGCTVNLVLAERVEEFRRSIATGYRKTTGLTPEIHVCGTADGAGRA
jgi:galactokinase